MKKKRSKNKTSPGCLWGWGRSWRAMIAKTKRRREVATQHQSPNVAFQCLFAAYWLGFSIAPGTVHESLVFNLLALTASVFLPNPEFARFHHTGRIWQVSTSFPTHTQDYELLPHLFIGQFLPHILVLSFLSLFLLAVFKTSLRFHPPIFPIPHNPEILSFINSFSQLRMICLDNGSHLLVIITKICR